MIRRLVYNAFGFLGSFEARALESDSHEPRRAQLQRLTSIVAAAAASAFGRDHGFSSIRTYEDFRAAVPVRDYEQLSAYVDRLVAGELTALTGEPPFMLATTSGTSGRPKFIPVTEGYLKEFRRASVASGWHLFRLFPGASRGVTLSVVSPAEEGRTPGGLPYGAISGGLFLREPALIRKFISPIPYEVFLIRDYEVRYYTLLRLALVLPLTSFYTLNPSTIVVLCKRLEKYAAALASDIGAGTWNPPGERSQDVAAAIAPFLMPDRARAAELEALIEKGQCVPHRVWPQLQLVCCWTRAAAAFYLSDFPRLFGSVPVCDITYGASEGRGSVFIGEAKQMLSIRSHFYEFVPEEEMDSPSRSALLADELEPGRNYYILLTTSGGLYRYHINDVVKVVGMHNRTPLLEFQYKGGNISSFTGEKVTELQVTEAMSGTLKSLGERVGFFTVVPEFSPNPHYQIWVEPATEPEGVAAGVPGAWQEVLSGRFDELLGRLNIEYRAKRDSQRLEAPSVRIIRPGSYESFRRELAASGVPDAQIKVSHLNPKTETRRFFESSLMN